MRLLRTSLVIALLAVAASSYAEMQQDWVVHWDGSGGDDHGLKIIADESGDIYIMGKTYNGSDYDYVILKYDGDTDSLLWERVYGRGYGDDVPRGIAVADGWVYVTGESSNGSDLDYLTLRLSAITGAIDWSKTYNGGRGDDEAYAVAVWGSDVYVTGESRGLLNDDVRTICYDASSGSQEWSESYNGGLNDYATAIAVDDANYVYVVGGTARAATGMNFLTILYNSAGTELWAKYKDGPGAIESDPDLAWDVAVYDDDVYVTGQMNGLLSGLDYGTVSYRRSDGYERWVAAYDGAAGGDDRARAITLGNDGSLWVTGTTLQSASWSQSCITTLKYDLAGNEICHDTHCSGMPYATEEGRDVATDAYGDAWVAGRLLSASYDYDFSVSRIEDGCNRTWSATYDRSGGDDDAYGIAAGGDAIYVTGESRQGGDLDITTARYADAPPIPTVTVTEPSGGEHWYVGTDHDITWTSQAVDYVDIEYTTDWGAPSPTWHTIVGSTPSDGHHTWEIPLIPDEPSSACRIRILDAAGGYAADTSVGSFEIYRFLVTRDAFGFDDDSHHSGPDDQIWPSECWEGYSAYPYTEWRLFDWEARTELLVDAWALLYEGLGGPAAWPASSAFPSWPMFVEIFGEDECYFDPPGGSVVFRPLAVYYWMYGLPKMHFGSCFGFASASCLVFDDLVPLSSLFPGYDHLYDVPLGDCSFDSGKMVTNLYMTNMFGAQHRAYNVAHVLTVSPTQTLNDVKAMLASEDRDHRPIAMWVKDCMMAHYDVPLRVEPHPTDPNIEYIHLYENFHEGVDTCRIEIDKSADTWKYIATWFDPDDWSGQGCRLYLADDASTFLDPPLLPDDYVGDVQIATAPGVYAGFEPTSRAKGISEPLYVNTSTGSFSFADQAWACEFDSLVAGFFSWGIFTDDGKALCYQRTDAAESDREEMLYAGDGQTAAVLNPGATTRTHDLTGLATQPVCETVCEAVGMTVEPGDSVRYSVMPDGGLRIDNFGAAADYGLRADIVDASGENLFCNESVAIDGMTRHRIWLNWQTHDNELSIDVDYGINGSVDETIWVVNQLAGGPEPHREIFPGSPLTRTSPNPFASRTVVDYYLPAAGAVRVEVFAPDGRRVARLVDKPGNAGWHSVPWEPRGLPSGLYFLKIAAEAGEYTQKIVLLK